MAIVGSMNLEFAGGGEANARDIAELFVRQGYDVTLFGTGIPKGYEEKAGEYIFHYVPSAFTFDIMATGPVLKISHILSMGLTGLYTYNRIYEKIKDFDVYYFISPTIMFRNVGYRLMKEGKTVILGNHGTFFEVLDMYGFASKAYSKILTKMIFRKLLKNKMKFFIHVQNKYQAQYYARIKCDPSYIREIPYNNVKFSNYGCFNNEEFAVVYLGRLMGSKGVDMLLELEKRADINLHIIGKGPYMERLQKLKNKNTVIHGYVSAQEKVMLLAGSDVMIVPSINESLSISAIEGLASGLYLIVSATSMGPRYIVRQDNIFGVAVPRNPKNFIKEIERIKSIKERNKMDYYKEKMLRREIAMKMFDADVVDKQLIELFTDAINRNNKRNQ
ncbi:MAG: glycosyltransferase family 4 protein [Candidatus Thermoplasmatota archaeon]|nr:glycosyltransferase family 4 protein [Candidatus Thermoplasmatota archaeon]